MHLFGVPLGRPHFLVLPIVVTSPFNEKLGLVGFHHKLAKGSCQFTIILHGAVDFKIGFRDKGESRNSNSCL